MEARSSIPAENARRARLYDALWNLAYQREAVTLQVAGTHNTEYLLTIGAVSHRGTLEQIESILAREGDA